MPASDASAELLMAKRYVKVSLNHCFCTWIGVPACKHNQTHRGVKMQRGEVCKPASRRQDRWGCREWYFSSRNAVHCCTPGTQSHRFARTWVGVRDEHPGCHVARRVGAELLRKDAEAAAGESLGDAERCGQADEPRAHHCHLGCCHLQGAELAGTGTYKVRSKAEHQHLQGPQTKD